MPLAAVGQVSLPPFTLLSPPSPCMSLSLSNGTLQLLDYPFRTLCNSVFISAHTPTTRRAFGQPVDYPQQVLIFICLSTLCLLHGPLRYPFRSLAPLRTDLHFHVALFVTSSGYFVLFFPAILSFTALYCHLYPFHRHFRLLFSFLAYLKGFPYSTCLCLFSLLVCSCMRAQIGGVCFYYFYCYFSSLRTLS